jgi:hypothetical protein
MYHCCWQIEGAVIGLSADENDLFSWFQSMMFPSCSTFPLLLLVKSLHGRNHGQRVAISNPHLVVRVTVVPVVVVTLKPAGRDDVYQEEIEESCTCCV